MEPTYSSKQMRRAQALTVFGRKYRDNNQPELARRYFEQALSIYPEVRRAIFDLAGLLYEMGEWDEALKWCDHGISLECSSGELHKWRIDILIQRGGIDAAFTYYQLARCDEKSLAMDDDAIGCCTVVRNGLERLPFFLDYYRTLGVNRFFFVDNASTDGTVDYLLQQPDVHVWHSPMSFKASTCGSAWFELLLRSYGQNRWWVMVDIDELLVYANSEQRPLHALCHQLSIHNKLAASGLFLDLYSDLPICDTTYTVGENLLNSCHFFDIPPYHSRGKLLSRYENQDVLAGGVRQRVFPEKDGYLLTKTPLVYYQLPTILGPGQHYSSAECSQIAHEICCMLHFKFIASFIQYAAQESQRKEYFDGAAHYQAYTEKLSQMPAITLFDPAISVRFEGTAQLQALKVLQEEPGHYEENCVPSFESA